MTKWQTLTVIVVALAVIGCTGFKPPALSADNINYLIDSAQIYITDPELNSQIDGWQLLYADNIEYLVDLFNDICEMINTGDSAFVPPGAPHPVKLVD
jgi:hypothetical protein